MAQIDAAFVRDVHVMRVSTAHHEQLLMMAPAAPDPLVEEHLTASLVDRFGQADVVLLGEVRLARVRAPQQTAHLHTAMSRLCENLADLRAWSAQLLVGVSLPVCEIDTVTGPERTEHLVQRPKVRIAIDQHSHAVAYRPRLVIAATSIDRTTRIAAFIGGQEPVLNAHRASASHISTPES